MSIPPDGIIDEPHEMANDLEERLKTMRNRVDIALLLHEQGYDSLIYTVIEDMAYGVQIILDRYCIRDDVSTSESKRGGSP